MSRAEMDALGWDSCDVIIVTGDAYVDHPSFGMAVIGRVLEAQGFRVGIIAQPDWQRRAVSGAGPAEPVLRRGRRQHGFDDQPLHGRPQDPQRRRLHARRRGRQAARPRHPGLHPALPGGLRGRAGGHRRHRGQPAPHRALRLLAGQGAPQRAGRQQGRPAAVRQRRARHRRDRAPAGGAQAARLPSPTCAARPSWCASGHEPQGFTQIDSTEVDQPGRIDDHINPYQTTEETARRASLCQGKALAAPSPRPRRAAAGWPCSCRRASAP
jgi:hypothetical protein